MFKHMIKKGYVDINKVLIDNYSKLNLSAIELVILLNLLESFKVNNLTLSVSVIAKKINVTTDECSNNLNNLLNKGYITLNIEYTKSGKAKEIFNIDELIKNLERILNEEVKVEKIQNSEETIKDYIEIIEKSFGKTLTPFELEIVLSWVDMKENITSIKKALDIAISKNILNLRYVDKIILSSKNTEIINEDESKVLDDIFRNIK